LLELYNLFPPQVSRERQVAMPAPAMFACSFRSDRTCSNSPKPRQQFVSRWKIPVLSSRAGARQRMLSLRLLQASTSRAACIGNLSSCRSSTGHQIGERQ